MRAVDQWRLIEARLPEGWEEAQLAFVVEEPDQAVAAAGFLGPLGPGRAGNEIRFQIRASASGGPQALTNLLGRRDRKRLWGTLSLRETTTVAPPPAEPSSVPTAPRETLVAAWDSLVRTLPPDWSDLLCRLALDSSDYLATASLLGAPLNPARIPDETALSFRVSGKQGYGASPLMVRRCFQRMDEQDVTGRLDVLADLADTENVGTQGPVWRVAGRSV